MVKIWNQLGSENYFQSFMFVFLVPYCLIASWKWTTNQEPNLQQQKNLIFFLKKIIIFYINRTLIVNIVRTNRLISMLLIVRCDQVSVLAPLFPPPFCFMPRFIYLRYSKIMLGVCLENSTRV